jgi:hypothetical protein
MMSRLDDIYNKGLKALDESYKEKRGHKKSPEDAEEESKPVAHELVLPPPKPKSKKKARK